jgi:hypothetical protein
VLNILKIFIYLFLPITSSANLKDDIQRKCPLDYTKYSNNISKYLIRMEDDINSNGCQVIPIYSSIIESNKLDILDSLEEDETLIKKLLKIFYINDDLSAFLFQNNSLKKIILKNSINEKFMENFAYLLKKSLHRKDIQNIKGDNSYFNYYILSAYYSKDKRDSLKLYKQMRESISLELLPSFTFLLSAIGDDYKFEDLLENFTTIGKELSTNALKNLVQYPQYFVYLLYPKEVNLNLGMVSSYKLKEIQRDIEQKTLFLYKTIYEKYRYEQGVNQVNYALLSLEYIYPYLLEQYSIDYDDFRNIFSRLIKKDYLITLFTQNKCSNNSKINFAIFGQNNIINISKFLKSEKKLSRKLFQELKSDKAIFSFFYIVNFYNNSNEKEWKLFGELLKKLPYDFQYRVALLKRLEKNGYFRNIIMEDDYKDKVYASNGTAYPKYKYILTTPYPSQNDFSLFEQILTTNISDKELKNALLELMQKDTNELATHTFTAFDKFSRGAEIAEKIDTAFLAIAIISAPFTGGVSLSYVAISTAKKAVKMGAKKGFSAMRKKVALKSREVLYKSIGNRKKYLNSEKIVIKNSQEMMNKTENIIGNSNNLLQVSTIVGTGLSFYLSNSALSTKQICEE